MSGHRRGGTSGAIAESMPGGGLNAPNSLGGHFASAPAIVAHADGTLEVFARDAQGELHRGRRRAPAHRPARG